MNMTLSPRETRLIKCLLQREHSRHELTPKVGAANIPDVVFRLRQRGLNIVCDRRPMVTRDKEKVFSGHYSLPSDEKPKAFEWIGEPAATGSTVSEDESQRPSNNDHFNLNRQGGQHG